MEGKLLEITVNNHAMGKTLDAGTHHRLGESGLSQPCSIVETTSASLLDKAYRHLPRVISWLPQPSSNHHLPSITAKG